VTVETTVSYLLGGLVLTLQVAAGAWAVAVVFGLILALGRETKAPGTRWPILVTVTAMRSAPQLVVLYIFYFGLSSVGINLSPLVAAVLALGITEAAYDSEYFRAGLLTVPQAQRDAAQSIGLSQFATFRLITLPQAIPYVFPPLLNSFVGLLKAATLASAVGVDEILYRGQNLFQITGQVNEIVLIVMAIYVIFTIPLTKAIAIYERHLRARVMA